MAKISDKLLPVLDQRANKYRQKYNWLRSEHDAVPALYQKKNQQSLGKFTQKANKKLLKPAFDACDKEQYANCQLCDALQRYDVKTYRAYRASQHKAAKAIFQAVKAGREWATAIETMRVEVDGIRKKRAAYVAGLEKQKADFLRAHTYTDPQAYNTLKAQLQSEYDALSARLDDFSAQKIAKKQKSLQGKMDRLSRKMTAITERSKAWRQQSEQLSEDVILSVRDLKMYFGGLKAVDELSFDVKKGEIFGLIGPNGAGKTTVFNCITQFYKPTGGALLFRTREGETVHLTDYKVHDIVLKGIVRTFQNLEVVKEVSVLDNLLIAATRQYTSNLAVQMLHLPFLNKEERVIRAKADQILEYMNLSAYRDRLAWGLPYGVLKRVEIARALMCDPQLIILDEPAAGLNESETRELASLIDRIRKDFDCTILLVEHDMSLVMNVCDHICAISFGKKLAYGTAAQIQASKEVQEAYLGTGGA